MDVDSRSLFCILLQCLNSATQIELATVLQPSFNIVLIQTFLHILEIQRRIYWEQLLSQLTFTFRSMAALLAVGVSRIPANLQIAIIVLLS